MEADVHDIKTGEIIPPNQVSTLIRRPRTERRTRRHQSDALPLLLLGGAFVVGMVVGVLYEQA